MGHLGGVLEGLGVVLGGLEAVLGRHGSFRVILGPARPCDAPHLRGPRGAKMRPKWHPRRTKIDDKNEVEKKKLLKIVLEPSWADLGSFWGPSWGRRMGFRLGETAFREKSRF